MCPPSFRERVLYSQPTGPNPLHHQDDSVDRPRAMGVELPFLYHSATADLKHIFSFGDSTPHTAHTGFACWRIP